MTKPLFPTFLLVWLIAQASPTKGFAPKSPSFDRRCGCSGDEQKLRESSWVLYGSKMKARRLERLVPQTEYVQVQDDGSDSWRTMDIAQLLDKGGIGVLPTETGYGIVTKLDSKVGLERILRIKGVHRCKKSLSLLCADMTTIDSYCYGIDKGVFKLLKRNLPGPYTFILPANTALPKGMFFDGKGHKHSWARQTVGVRFSADPILRYVQDELLQGAPLLVSSLPREQADDEDIDPFMSCSVDLDASWCNSVDFVVDAGVRPLEGSTIYSLVKRDEPELIREGVGDVVLSR